MVLRGPVDPRTTTVPGTGEPAVPPEAGPVAPRPEIETGTEAVATVMDAAGLHRLEDAETEAPVAGLTEGPRENFRSQMAAFARARESDPEEARRLLREVLPGIAAEIESHLRTNAGELSADLVSLQRFYRMGAAFLREHRSAPESSEYMAEATTLSNLEGGLSRTEGAMRTLRDYLRGTLTVPPGGVPTREQVENARLVAALSDELGHHAALPMDLRRWTELLNALPPGSMGEEARADHYTKILQRWSHVRDAVTGVTERPEGAPPIMVDETAIVEEMREVREGVLGNLGFLAAPRAATYVEELLDTLIDADDVGARGRMSADGLEEYCAGRVRAEEAAAEAARRDLLDPAFTRSVYFSGEGPDGSPGLLPDTPPDAHPLWTEYLRVMAETPQTQATRNAASRVLGELRNAIVGDVGLRDYNRLHTGPAYLFGLTIEDCQGALSRGEPIREGTTERLLREMGALRAHAALGNAHLATTAEEHLSRSWEAYREFRAIGDAEGMHGALEEIRLYVDSVSAEGGQLTDADRIAIRVRILHERIDAGLRIGIIYNMQDLQGEIDELWDSGDPANQFLAHRLMLESARAEARLTELYGTNSPGLEMIPEPGIHPGTDHARGLGELTAELESSVHDLGDAELRNARLLQLAQGYGLVGANDSAGGLLDEVATDLRESGADELAVRGALIAACENSGLRAELDSRVESWIAADRADLRRAGGTSEARIEMLRDWVALAAGMQDTHQAEPAQWMITLISEETVGLRVSERIEVYSEFLREDLPEDQRLPEDLRTTLLAQIRTSLTEDDLTTTERVRMEQVLIANTEDVEEIGRIADYFGEVLDSGEFTDSETVLSLARANLDGLARTRALYQERLAEHPGEEPAATRVTELTLELQYRFAQYRIELSNRGYELSHAPGAPDEDALALLNEHFQNAIRFGNAHGVGVPNPDAEVAAYRARTDGASLEEVAAIRAEFADSTATASDEYAAFLNDLPAGSRIECLASALQLNLENNRPEEYDALLDMVDDTVEALPPGPERRQAILRLAPLLSRGANAAEALFRERQSELNQARTRLTEMREEAENMTAAAAFAPDRQREIESLHTRIRELEDLIGGPSARVDSIRAHEVGLWERFSEGSTDPAVLTFARAMTECARGNDEASRRLFHEMLEDETIRSDLSPETAMLRSIAETTIGIDSQTRIDRTFRVLRALYAARSFVWETGGYITRAGDADAMAIDSIIRSLPQFLSTLSYDEMPQTFEEALDLYARSSDGAARSVRAFDGAVSRMPLCLGEDGTRTGSVWTLVRRLDHMDTEADARAVFSSIREILGDDTSHVFMNSMRFFASGDWAERGEGAGDLGPAIQDLCSLLLEEFPGLDAEFRGEVERLRDSVPDEEAAGASYRELFSLQTAAEIALEVGIFAATGGIGNIAAVSVTRLLVAGARMVCRQMLRQFLVRGAIRLAAYAARTIVSRVLGSLIMTPLQAMMAGSRDADIGRAAFNMTIDTMGADLLMSMLGPLRIPGRMMGRALTRIAGSLERTMATRMATRTVETIGRVATRSAGAAAFTTHIATYTGAFMVAGSVRHEAERRIRTLVDTDYTRHVAREAEMRRLYEETGNEAFLREADAARAAQDDILGPSALMDFRQMRDGFCTELAEEILEAAIHRGHGGHGVDVTTEVDDARLNADERARRTIAREARVHAAARLRLSEAIARVAEARFAEGGEGRRRIEAEAAERFPDDADARERYVESETLRGRVNAILHPDHPAFVAETAFLTELAEAGLLENFTPETVAALSEQVNEIHPPEIGPDGVATPSEAGREYLRSLMSLVEPETLARFSREGLATLQAAADAVLPLREDGSRSAENLRLLADLISAARPTDLRHPSTFIESVAEAHRVLAAGRPEITDEDGATRRVETGEAFRRLLESRRFAAPIRAIVESARRLASGETTIRESVDIEATPDGDFSLTPRYELGESSTEAVTGRARRAMSGLQAMALDMRRLGRSTRPEDAALRETIPAVLTANRELPALLDRLAVVERELRARDLPADRRESLSAERETLRGGIAARGLVVTRFVGELLARRSAPRAESAAIASSEIRAPEAAPRPEARSETRVEETPRPEGERARETETRDGERTPAERHETRRGRDREGSRPESDETRRRRTSRPAPESAAPRAEREGEVVTLTERARVVGRVARERMVTYAAAAAAVLGLSATALPAYAHPGDLTPETGPAPMELASHLFTNLGHMMGALTPTQAVAAATVALGFGAIYAAARRLLGQAAGVRTSRTADATRSARATGSEADTRGGQQQGRQEESAAPEPEMVAEDNRDGEPRRGRIDRREGDSAYGTASASTHEGEGYKSVNEDALLQGIDVDGNHYAVVFDGMGGMGRGDQASRLAAEVIGREMRAHNDLARAIAVAHRAIRTEFPGAGTTVVAHRVLVGEDGRAELELIHAGDAGAVVIGADGRVLHRTEDQSQVQFLRSAGELEGDELAMRAHPDNNIVLGGLGAGNSHPVRTVLPLSGGERVVMFSDGLGDNLSTEEIVALARAHADPAAAQEALMTSALAKMRILEAMREPLENVPYGTRLPFTAPDGRTLYIAHDYFETSQGPTLTTNVYDAAEGGRLVDHYKPDNLTAHVYFHHPAADAAASYLTRRRSLSPEQVQEAHDRAGERLREARERAQWALRSLALEFGHEDTAFLATISTEAIAERMALEEDPEAVTEELRARLQFLESEIAAAVGNGTLDPDRVQGLRERILQAVFLGRPTDLDIAERVVEEELQHVWNFLLPVLVERGVAGHELHARLLDDWRNGRISREEAFFQTVEFGMRRLADELGVPNNDLSRELIGHFIATSTPADIRRVSRVLRNLGAMLPEGRRAAEGIGDPEWANLQDEIFASVLEGRVTDERAGYEFLVDWARTHRASVPAFEELTRRVELETDSTRPSARPTPLRGSPSTGSETLLAAFASESTEETQPGRRGEESGVFPVTERPDEEDTTPDADADRATLPFGLTPGGTRVVPDGTSETTRERGLAFDETAAPTAEPSVPRTAQPSQGLTEVLARYSFPQPTGTINLSHERYTLENFADPAQPDGPITRLARLAWRALGRAHVLGREISLLAGDPSAAEAVRVLEHELAAQLAVVGLWESARPTWAEALLHARSIRGSAARVYNLLSELVDLPTLRRSPVEPGYAPLEATAETGIPPAVRPLILEVEGNQPEAFEIAERWLDPAESDQGASTFEAGSMAVVVANQGDIADVARAVAATMADTRMLVMQREVRQAVVRTAREVLQEFLGVDDTRSRALTTHDLWLTVQAELPEILNALTDPETRRRRGLPEIPDRTDVADAVRRALSRSFESYFAEEAGRAEAAVDRDLTALQPSLLFDRENALDEVMGTIRVALSPVVGNGPRYTRILTEIQERAAPLLAEADAQLHPPGEVIRHLTAIVRAAVLAQSRLDPEILRPHLSHALDNLEAPHVIAAESRMEPDADGEALVVLGIPTYPGGRIRVSVRTTSRHNAVLQAEAARIARNGMRGEVELADAEAAAAVVPAYREPGRTREAERDEMAESPSRTEEGTAPARPRVRRAAPEAATPSETVPAETAPPAAEGAATVTNPPEAPLPPLLQTLVDMTAAANDQVYDPALDISYAGESDVTALVALIRRLGTDRLEAVLAAAGGQAGRLELIRDNLSILLNAAERNPEGPLARFLAEASIQELSIITQERNHFAATMLRDPVFTELLAGRMGVEEARDRIAALGDQLMRDALLSLLVLREFRAPSGTPEGANLLRMFGIDRAQHPDFPWTNADLRARVELYVRVAATRRRFAEEIVEAVGAERSAQVEAFMQNLWRVLEVQDVQDTILPYTPHGWGHSLEVMEISERIFDASPVLRAELTAQFGSEAVARVMVQFIGIFHDAGYGCLCPHEKKGIHAERSGELFLEQFTEHMNAVFGIDADSPRFQEIFLAIQRHGADKRHDAEYMEASDKDNPLLFIIRLADNLDLTTDRLREIQTHPAVLDALREMFALNESPEFENAGSAEREALVAAIRDRHIRHVLPGRMSAEEARLAAGLLMRLNETSYPHVAGCVWALNYAVREGDQGQFIADIFIEGRAEDGGSIREGDREILNALYQVHRTYQAVKSLSYRGRPLEVHYVETFRVMDQSGHELATEESRRHQYRTSPPGSLRVIPGGGMEAFNEGPAANDVQRLAAENTEVTAPPFDAPPAETSRPVPTIYRVGAGAAPALIVASPHETPTWRVSKVEGGRLTLTKVDDLTVTTEASGPEPCPFEMGAGVEIAGIGGGGRAFPRVDARANPLLFALQLAMERAAAAVPGSEEHRRARLEVQTLMEIEHAPRLRVPAATHPMAELSRLLRILAENTAQELGRVAPDSEAFQEILSHYRAQRDEYVQEILDDFSPPLLRVLTFLNRIATEPGLWEEIHEAYPHLRPPHVVSEIHPHGRVKAPPGVLAKIVRRNWNSLEPMTDFAGARLVVDSYEDVVSALAAIQARYDIREVRDANGDIVSDKTGSPIPDRDTLRRTIEGVISRGYRALHVVVEVDGLPVEIQIQTHALYEWGQIQHDLIYKGESLPVAVREAINVFCRDAANYLADFEQGATPTERPSSAGILESLPAGLSPDLREEIEGALHDMSLLLADPRFSTRRVGGLRVLPGDAGRGRAEETGSVEAPRLAAATTDRAEAPPALDPATADSLPAFAAATAQTPLAEFPAPVRRLHLTPILRHSVSSGLEFASLAIEVDGHLVTTNENYATSHSARHVSGEEHAMLFQNAVLDLETEPDLSRDGTFRIYSFHTHPTRESASSFVRSPNQVHADGRPYTLTNDADWESYQSMFRAFVAELRAAGWRGPIELVAGAVPSGMTAEHADEPYVATTTLRAEALEGADLGEVAEPTEPGTGGSLIALGAGLTLGAELLASATAEAQDTVHAAAPVAGSLFGHFFTGAGMFDLMAAGVATVLGIWAAVRSSRSAPELPSRAASALAAAVRRIARNGAARRAQPIVPSAVADIVRDLLGVDPESYGGETARSLHRDMERRGESPEAARNRVAETVELIDEFFEEHVLRSKASLRESEMRLVLWGRIFDAGLDPDTVAPVLEGIGRHLEERRSAPRPSFDFLGELPALFDRALEAVEAEALPPPTQLHLRSSAGTEEAPRLAADLDEAAEGGRTAPTPRTTADSIVEALRRAAESPVAGLLIAGSVAGLSLLMSPDVAHASVGAAADHASHWLGHGAMLAMGVMGAAAMVVGGRRGGGGETPAVEVSPGASESEYGRIRPRAGADRIVIGRGEGHLTDDEMVSTAHCTLARADGRWYIRDGSVASDGTVRLSKNGVRLLNPATGEQLALRRTGGDQDWFAISPGVGIMIGRRWFIFEAPVETASVPTTAPTPAATTAAAAPTPTVPEPIPAPHVDLAGSGLPLRQSRNGAWEIDLDALGLPLRSIADTAWLNPGIEDRGGIAARSNQGQYSKPTNEDRYLIMTLPGGRSLIAAIDGVGGHTGGERAAEIARQVVARAVAAGRSVEEALGLARQAIQQDNVAIPKGKPDAVGIFIEVAPAAGGRYRARFLNISDSEAIVIRPGLSDPIVHTTGRPTELVRLMNAGLGTPLNLTPDGRLARGQTMVWRIDPNANVVEHTIGSDAAVHTTSPVEDLLPGDIILAGSDGLFENFGSHDVIVELIRQSGARTPAAINQVVMEEALLRQALYKLSRGGRTLDHELYVQAYRLVHEGRDPPAGWAGMYETASIGRPARDAEGRIRLDAQGRPLANFHPGPFTIDPEGNVRAAGGVIVDHFKRDNVTLVVQVVGQDITAPGEAPVAAEAEPRLAAFTAEPAAASPPTLVVGAHPYLLAHGGQVDPQTFLYQVRCDDAPGPGVSRLREVRSSRPLSVDEVESALNGASFAGLEEVADGWSTRSFLTFGANAEVASRTEGGIPLAEILAVGGERVLDFYGLPDAAAATAPVSSVPFVTFGDPLLDAGSGAPAFSLVESGGAWRLMAQQGGISWAAPAPEGSEPNFVEIDPRRGPVMMQAGCRIQIGMTVFLFDGATVRTETSSDVRLTIP